MALDTRYIRNFHRQVLGKVTSGFDAGHGSVVRDNSGRLLGRTTTRFNESRDSSNRIVSSNKADIGLLIRRR